MTHKVGSSWLWRSFDSIYYPTYTLYQMFLMPICLMWLSLLPYISNELFSNLSSLRGNARSFRCLNQEDSLFRRAPKTKEKISSNKIYRQHHLLALMKSVRKVRQGRRQTTLTIVPWRPWARPCPHLLQRAVTLMAATTRKRLASHRTTYRTWATPRCRWT